MINKRIKTNLGESRNNGLYLSALFPYKNGAARYAAGFIIRALGGGSKNGGGWPDWPLRPDTLTVLSASISPVQRWKWKWKFRLVWNQFSDKNKMLMGKWVRDQKQKQTGRRLRGKSKHSKTKIQRKKTLVKRDQTETNQQKG